MHVRVAYWLIVAVYSQPCKGLLERYRIEGAEMYESLVPRAVVITDLVSVHLLFLGGKEPKSRWTIMHFEFAAKKPGGK